MHKLGILNRPAYTSKQNQTTTKL